jgi:hypothetical protein
LTHEGTCQICQKILGVDILGRAVVDVGHSWCSKQFLHNCSKERIQQLQKREKWKKKKLVNMQNGD